MIDLDNISFDHCIKCTVCTVYCPVARVTPLYPGPKFAGPDTERLRIKNPDLYDESLKYCSNCKRCEIVCPSDVKITDIIKAAGYHDPQRRRLRDLLLSSTDLVGRVATRTSALTNRVMRFSPLRGLMQLTLGLTRERPFPRYAAGSFRSWFRRQQAQQAGFDATVVYYHGCYVNYNDPDLGRSVVAVLNQLNVGVRLAAEKCCGIPLISNNRLREAGRHARHNVRVLTQAIAGTADRIVLSSSSCCLALTHEYHELLQVDTSTIRPRIDLVTDFICRRLETAASPALNPMPLTVAYHAPCHLERMGGVVHTIALLRKIPELDLRILHSECCGISGTYGFKEENYAISQDIGSNLFDQIRRIGPDLVVTDCETCKWQIEFNTPFPVVHPITLLARAMPGCLG